MIIDDREREHRRLVRDARAQATANGHDLKPFEVDKRISTSATNYEGTSFCRRCGAVAMTSTMNADSLRGDALSANCRKVSR